MSFIEFYSDQVDLNAYPAFLKCLIFSECYNYPLKFVYIPVNIFSLKLFCWEWKVFQTSFSWSFLYSQNTLHKIIFTMPLFYSAHTKLFRILIARVSFAPWGEGYQLSIFKHLKLVSSLSVSILSSYIISIS